LGDFGDLAFFGEAIFFGLLAALLACLAFFGDSTFFFGTTTLFALLVIFFGEAGLFAAAAFLAVPTFLVPLFFDTVLLDLVFLGLAEAVVAVPVDEVLTAVVEVEVDFFLDEVFFFPDLFFLTFSPASLYEALTFLKDVPAPRCSEILTCFLAASGSTLKF